MAQDQSKRKGITSRKGESRKPFVWYGRKRLLIVYYVTPEAVWKEEHDFRKVEDLESAKTRLLKIPTCVKYEVWLDNEKLEEWQR